jgi:hypothetical protein
MLTEIKNLHTQINKDQMVRIVTIRNNFEICIDRTDIIKCTKSGMLRIIRANGNITSINPEFIVMTCIVKRSALL